MTSGERGAVVSTMVLCVLAALCEGIGYRGGIQTDPRSDGHVFQR
jgi:hypothetical protein